MTKAGHLRLLPKPLAKCAAPYPPARREGVDLRREGRVWRIVHVRNGRIVELLLTQTELVELAMQASAMLAKDGDDGDDGEQR